MSPPQPGFPDNITSRVTQSRPVPVQRFNYSTASYVSCCANTLGCPPPHSLSTHTPGKQPHGTLSLPPRRSPKYVSRPADPPPEPGPVPLPHSPGAVTPHPGKSPRRCVPSRCPGLASRPAPLSKVWSARDHVRPLPPLHRRCVVALAPALAWPPAAPLPSHRAGVLRSSGLRREEGRAAGGSEEVGGPPLPREGRN